MAVRRGVVLVLVLIIMAVAVSAMGLLFMGLAVGRPAPVSSNSTLLLDVSGDLAETEPVGLGQFLDGQPTVRSLVEALRKASVDRRVSSVIIREDILPKFKQGDLAGGIMAGSEAVIGTLQLTPQEAARRAQEAGASAKKREIDVACSSIDLAGAEIAMSTMIGRERALERAFAPVMEDYDFICIDTPPSLGLLTINALTAADKVIVPVQCEYLSMRGLIQLQNTLQMIREHLNPDVDIEGILPTLVDSRTIHAKEAIEILEENFGDRVFASRIRKTIRFAEAPVKGMSVLKYDPDGVAAQSYRDLAKEVLSHGQRS